MSYFFAKTLPGGSFDDAITRVTQALQQEGFGILTEIDVAATMQKKLGLSIPAYTILGACNPQLARQAIDAQPEIGVLLPCNVVVSQADGGVVHVDFMDPQAVAVTIGPNQLFR